MSDSKFLAITKKAAIEAGKIIKKYSELEYAIHDKGRKNDFATQADLESEKTIIKIIKDTFPEHNIIAEESGIENNNSEYTWAIDPLDGTTSYIARIPTYGISIALLKNNKLILGVINLVVSNEFYWAEKGKGAFLNGKKIRVSTEKDLANSVIALEFGHTDRDMKVKRYLNPLISNVRFAYIFGSSVLPYGYVSCGILDGLTFRANIWDHAAGAIIVQEAGGQVTDLEGKEIDWSEKRMEIIASNGLIHDELLKALNNNKA